MPTNVDPFLDQVRSAYAPDPDAKARVRKAIGLAIVASSATVASSTMGATAAAKVGLGAKAGGIGFGVILGGLAATVVLVGVLSSADTRPWETSTRVRAATEFRGVDRIEALASAIVGARPSTEPWLEPIELSPPAEDAAKPAQDQARHARGPLGRSASAVAKESTSHELLEELRLIRSATQALRDGNTKLAQSELDAHKARFAKGRLSLERRGLYVLLQCSVGSGSGARAAAEAFLESAPLSPLASHVREDCLK